MPRLTGLAVPYSVVTHHPRVAADYLAFASCGGGCSVWLSLEVCVSLPPLLGRCRRVPAVACGWLEHVRVPGAGGWPCSAAGEGGPLTLVRCLVCGLPARPAGPGAPGTLTRGRSVPSGGRAEPARVPGSALSTALVGRQQWARVPPAVCTFRAHPVLVAGPCAFRAHSLSRAPVVLAPHSGLQQLAGCVPVPTASGLLTLPALSALCFCCLGSRPCRVPRPRSCAPPASPGSSGVAS